MWSKGITETATGDWEHILLLSCLAFKQPSRLPRLHTRLHTRTPTQTHFEGSIRDNSITCWVKCFHHCLSHDVQSYMCPGEGSHEPCTIRGDSTWKSFFSAIAWNQALKTGPSTNPFGTPLFSLLPKLVMLRNRWCCLKAESVELIDHSGLAPSERSQAKARHPSFFKRIMNNNNYNKNLQRKILKQLFK